MPGSNLNFDFPTGNDTFAVWSAKVLTILAAIQADLEPRVSAGELDINTELSLGGAPLTNAGGVRLVGGTSAVVGTLYMDEELHAVTTDGDIQITSNGGLNIAALGTIGGNYGGANPALVEFIDASSAYYFWENGATSNYADLLAKEIVLNGALGTMRLRCDNTMAGGRTLAFKDFSATVGLMAYTAAGNAVVDAATVTPVVGAMTFGGDIGLGARKITHGDRTKSFVFGRTSNLLDANCVVSSTILQGGVLQAGGGGNIATYAVEPLDYNQRLKSIVVRGDVSLAGNFLTLYKVSASGVYSTVAGTISQVAVANNWTLTPTTPALLAAGETYALHLTSNSGANKLYNATITYDSP